MDFVEFILITIIDYTPSPFRKILIRYHLTVLKNRNIMKIGGTKKTSSEFKNISSRFFNCLHQTRQMGSIIKASICIKTHICPSLHYYPKYLFFYGNLCKVFYHYR